MLKFIQPAQQCISSAYIYEMQRNNESGGNEWNRSLNAGFMTEIPGSNQILYILISPLCNNGHVLDFHATYSKTPSLTLETTEKKRE